MAEGLRERMVAFGTASLTDTDLLTMILSGSGPGPTDQVAQQVLSSVGSLGGLLTRRASELAALPGMTEARADRLLAAVELGRRAALPKDLGAPLKLAKDVADRFARYASDPNETFLAVGVNARNRVTFLGTIATGWESGVNLTTRQVFTILAKENVSRVIFVHNHPSGDPTPSAEDVRFTKRLIEAAELLEIKVLDHVIVSSGGFSNLRSSHGSELNFK